MSRLVPNSLDDRFRLLDDVCAARFDALTATSILVYATNSVEPTALPALAWQFGALGQTWQTLPDDAAKRAHIRRVLWRRRHRGTHAAVEDALEAAGFLSNVRDGLGGEQGLYNGAFAHSGVICHGTNPAYEFWVVVVGEPTPTEVAAIEAITYEWQRRSQRFRVFWVEEESQLEETEEYHAVAS